MKKRPICFSRISRTASSRTTFFRGCSRFPNVIITGHQAFFTDTALKAIAEETLANITAFEQNRHAAGVDYRGESAGIER